MITDLTAIFVNFDDFCLQFKQTLDNKLIGPESHSSLSISEVGTILIAFHLSDYRHFKHFYLQYVCKHLHREFPQLVSYNRFLELIPNAFIYLVSFLNRRCMGECTGISFIDSTPLKVCHNKRIPSHKVFDGLAKRGKTSVDWFFGFKLHLVINDRGDILACQFTPGNVDDRAPVKKLSKGLSGYLFGDKGYLKQDLFEELYERGVKLVTKIKKNMKNCLVPMFEKVMLRKRAIIESVNDFLKNVCQIEHSRHRSPANAFVHMVSALIAYSFLPKKPSLNLSNLPSIQLFHSL
jgi:hypothetical protein